jgi:hypothetical protein
MKNKNGQPLPGMKQFRRNQFSTSADFLFLLLFSKKSQRNSFPRNFIVETDQQNNQQTDGPT